MTTQQSNLLQDYHEIIDTYLDGLHVKTGLNFKSAIDLKDYTVTIERLLTKLPNVKLPTYTFHFDNDILSKTDVRDFKILLDIIKRLLTKTILQFDDKFYKDRYDGVSFIDDRKFEFNLQNGEGHKIYRIDEINWKSLFVIE